MATRKTNVKSKTETQTNEATEDVTLEQALKEEGEGRMYVPFETSGYLPLLHSMFKIPLL